MNIFDILFHLFVATLSDSHSLAAIKNSIKSTCIIQHLSNGNSHAKVADHTWVKIWQYFIISENVRTVAMMVLVIMSISKWLPGLPCLAHECGCTEKSEIILQITFNQPYVWMPTLSSKYQHITLDATYWQKRCTKWQALLFSCGSLKARTLRQSNWLVACWGLIRPVC